MDDDLNTPMVIATLFDACRVINQANDGAIALSQADIDTLRQLMQTFAFEVLGLRDNASGDAATGIDLTPYQKAVDLLLEVRRNAKAAKDWATSDLIRDRLTKDGVEWRVK